MNTILIPLLAFVLGFVGVAGFQYFRMQDEAPPVTPSPIVANSTPEPTLTLIPPSEALSGVLTVTRGHAQLLSRKDPQYKEASSGAQILLGESIATKANSSAIAEVTGIMKASLGPTAELVFANMIPENFVLQQKNGKIEYIATKPISVRALHTLVSMDPGDVIITIIDSDMSVTVKSGSVKLALVDTDNNTNVWNLTANQRANIDDTTREVTLIKAR